LLAMLAAKWGVDSRPLDADRPTRWWPATPRDWTARQRAAWPPL